MYERANSSTKVAEAYKEACTLYKQGGDSKKAIQYNTILARLYEEKNRTSQAGKVYDALAELYVDRNQIPDAIVAYENSLRCRTILDQVVHQNEIKLKLAELCANNSRYEKAIELFEEIAEPVKGRTNYSAPGYYWKAVLCRMRLEVEATAEIQQSQDDFLRYQELCPHFNQGATRRSCALLASLYEEFKKESVDGFEAALQTYRANGGVLSAWDVDMLTAVKNSLETPVIKTPEPQGGQPDSDDDFT
jgi:tetratricopeptide (TPR) repeat protein